VLFRSGIVDFRQLTVRKPGASQATLLYKHVEALLHSRRFTDQAGGAVPVNRPCLLRGTIALPSGTEVIDPVIGALPLRSIYVEAEFQRIETSLPIERYALGESVKIALGRGKVDRFPVTMSVAEERDGRASLRVHFQTLVGGQRLELVDGRFVTE
jgi:hypothetical protein